MMRCTISQGRDGGRKSEAMSGALRDYEKVFDDEVFCAKGRAGENGRCILSFASDRINHGTVFSRGLVEPYQPTNKPLAYLRHSLKLVGDQTVLHRKNGSMTKLSR